MLAIILKKEKKNRIMKRIKNIKELPFGTEIVRLNGGNVDYYEFLMVHPHNDSYVLLLESLSQEAKKFYIPRVDNSDEWQTDYTDIELLEYQRNYHLGMANRKLARIKEKEGK